MHYNRGSGKGGRGIKGGAFDYDTSSDYFNDVDLNGFACWALQCWRKFSRDPATRPCATSIGGGCIPW